MKYGILFVWVVAVSLIGSSMERMGIAEPKAYFFFGLICGIVQTGLIKHLFFGKKEKPKQIPQPPQTLSDRFSSGYKPSFREDV